MQEKKYFIIIFLDFVWQKLNFFFNKTTKYSLMGVCQTHPKTQKPFNKIYGKPNRVLKPLTHFFLLDSIKLTRLGWPEIFGLTINRARNPSLTRKQPKKKPKTKKNKTPKNIKKKIKRTWAKWIKHKKKWITPRTVKKIEQTQQHEIQNKPNLIKTKAYTCWKSCKDR